MRLLAGILRCGLVGLAILLAPFQLSAQPPWTPLSEDLEIFVSPEIPEPGSKVAPNIIFVRSSLSKYRVSVVRAAEFGMKRSSAKTLCRARKASVCINSNFFDEHGDPLGLVISRGVLHRKIHRQGNTLTGVFSVTRDGLAIDNRASFDSRAVLEAVQAGPRLVSDGTPVQGISDSTRSGRAGVCIDAKNNLILFAISSGFRGITLQELQQSLISNEISCKNALNFDGGGSTQLYFNDQQLPPTAALSGRQVIGFDEVPVVLALVKTDS